MPNIAKVLKDEISRIARKEMRVVFDKTRAAATRQQREITSLKNQVKALERQLSALEKGAAQSGAEPPGPAAAKQVRFVAKGLVSTRKRLGLSAADLAKVMGVSAQTIYNWERGATRPNAELQEKLASLRGVGKRKMQEQLAAREA